MQAYEEVEASKNANAVPLLILLFRINSKSYYIFYIFHDLIWSLIFLVFGILLRIEVIEASAYMSLFGKNYSYFIYTIISFGGVFLLLLVMFAAYANEIPYNIAKKIYVFWRIGISIIHLIGCLFLVIFFGIYDSTFQTVLFSNNASSDVIYDFHSYFIYGISITSFLVFYSMINVFNSFMLIKACKKIQGEYTNERIDTNQGWGNKVVPLNT